MAQQQINIGSADLAGDGESLRTAFGKVNNNFDEVYVSLSEVQSFDGNYNSLTNLPDLSGYALTVNTFNGDYNNLTNRPTLFSGLYTDLTGAPSVPAQIGDLTDVNISGVTDGQILAFDDSTGSFINVAAPSGGGSSDADTLDGQEGTYYLDYTNFTNTPSIPADISELTDTTNLLSGGGTSPDFNSISVTIADEADPQSISDALNDLITQIQGLGV
jgi:hypothetical protein